MSVVAVVTLPSNPAPMNATMTPVSFATEMSGPLGGPTQRVLRIGDRWKLDLEYGPMAYADARPFLARLTRAAATPVAVLFPQRGLRPAYPGAVVVAGSGATGGLLPVRGGLPGFGLVEGQFFALSSGGRRWIHQVQQDTALDATGAATLPINPLLRVQPADGDALEFVAPMLEGFPAMGWNWTIENINRVGLKFSVTEDR